jgi:hypothetical protein
MVKWQNVLFMGKLWCHSMIFSITKHSGKPFGFENVLFGLGMDCQMGTMSMSHPEI